MCRQNDTRDARPALLDKARLARRRTKLRSPGETFRARELAAQCAVKDNIVERSKELCEPRPADALPLRVAHPLPRQRLFSFPSRGRLLLLRRCLGEDRTLLFRRLAARNGPGRERREGAVRRRVR